MLSMPGSATPSTLPCLQSSATQDVLIIGSPSLAGKVASRGGNRVVTKSTTLAPLLAVVAVLACSLVSHHHDHHDDDGIPQCSAVEGSSRDQ